MLEPESLLAFVAVAEEGHFVRAGDRMGCAQSVISKRLKRLEDQLGIRLVTRNRRSKVGLTREGLQFLPTARATLAQLEKAEVHGRRLAGGQAGALRIGFVFSAIMTGVMPDLIRALRVALPALEIVPIAMETPEQIVAIGDDRLDVALVRPRPSYPAETWAKCVHREGVQLALPAAHPLTARKRIACADLAANRFIVPQFREEAGLIDVIDRIVKIGKLPPPEVVRTKDFITAGGLAAAGTGVAVVPTSLTALALEGLVYRPIIDLDFRLELVLLCREGLPQAIAKVLRAAGTRLAR
ncbi:MAG: LysR family transcriptional regulator [Rhodospirillaceae bacterium]|nr:MAG: LysR family transcriptional regulator [Rhodospirillaceae bacterium]